jgi:hypothetical protein
MLHVAIRRVDAWPQEKCILGLATGLGSLVIEQVYVALGMKLQVADGSKNE